jgi:hypothetical protein
MAKSIGPKLSKEANRVALTVMNSLKVNDFERVFVRSRHLAQRSKLQSRELPAALAELITSNLFVTETTHTGCFFALQPITT